MTRKSKVSMWRGFHRALCPLFPLVPSRRHHYCQMGQLLRSFVPVFLHCFTARGRTSSVGRGFTWCHDLTGSWPTLPLLPEALRAMPGPAQSCPLPGWGVQVCGCPCVVTKSDCRGGKKSISFGGLALFLDFSFKNEAKPNVCVFGQQRVYLK